MIRLWRAVIVPAAVGTLASGCLVLGRTTHGPQEWRELYRADRPVVALSVDSEGFYDKATCARICKTYSVATVERCYPVDLVVPVPHERIVTCSYAHTHENERRAVPLAELDGATIDRAGYVDRKTCERVCADPGGDPEREVLLCTVAGDESRAPAGDGAFVVCAIHFPGGFSRTSAPNKQGRWVPR